MRDRPSREDRLSTIFPSKFEKRFEVFPFCTVPPASGTSPLVLMDHDGIRAVHYFPSRFLQPPAQIDILEVKKKPFIHHGTIGESGTSQHHSSANDPIHRPNALMVPVHH